MIVSQMISAPKLRSIAVQPEATVQSGVGDVHPLRGDQIASTMTVGELIEFLNNFDEDEKVYLSHDNGYTYGGITASRFEDVEEETENE